MKKTRVILSICILLCAALTATLLFACGGSYTITLEGDLYPGSSLTPVLYASDGTPLYVDTGYTVTVTEGTDVASVQNAFVTIAQTARIGDAFTVQVKGASASASARFIVAAPPVSKVTVLCADQAEAGDTLLLSAKISPSVYDGSEATYAVKSGNATLSGNALTVSPLADHDETILVTASFDGVTSVEKRITVTTYQPHEITLTADEYACLAGRSLTAVFAVDPSYASYPLSVEIAKGAAYAEYDAETGTLTMKDDAQKGSEVVLRATCGSLSREATFTVDNPPAREITVQANGKNVSPGEAKTFAYALSPADADRTKVRVYLETGEDYVEWADGNTSFTVKGDAPQDAEITFLLVASDKVQTYLTYTVEKRKADSIYIETNSPTSYLASGSTVTFEPPVVSPVDWKGDVTYTVLEGAELVDEKDGVFTVKQGAGIGTVRVQAITSDGAKSNEVSFTVRGRYSRRVYSSWNNVKLSPSGENDSIWMVLPSTLNAANLTILVPKAVTDLIIEGFYDGTEATAYKNLYFYFRNAATRTVTLKNFATMATSGLGGTIMDFGTSGTTNLVLVGKNAIYADSPYYLNNSDESVNGVWYNDASPSNNTIAWRSGKYGYNGTNGGTAICGYDLLFTGDGSLTAAAGDGADGTNGGNGANAVYNPEVLIYLSGNGGAGGNGGDAGAAIRAYQVTFSSGNVTAIAGFAGEGGAGGAAGNISALGSGVTATVGDAGANGKSGVQTPAVSAKYILGTHYVTVEDEIRVKSRQKKTTESLDSLVRKLASFYGVQIEYGTGADTNYYKSSYPMTKQTNAAKLMEQTQFLMYTFSVMPKNLWREFYFVNNNLNQPIINLVKTIKNGKVLGLTNDTNHLWFATFETEMRGVIYSGYYNIMLHEFTHVCHYNLDKASSAVRLDFESSLQSHNFELKYTDPASSKERVYGVLDENTATTSCFLTTYSRTNVREDTAETLSLCSVYSTRPDFLAEGTPVRIKFDIIVTAFSRAYETMSTYFTPNLFAYDHLFDE